MIKESIKVMDKWKSLAGKSMKTGGLPSLSRQFMTSSDPMQR